MDVVYKTCTMCHKSFPISNFGINRTKKDGHQNICKECRRKYDAQRIPALKQKAQERREKARENGGKKYCPDCGRDLPVSHFYKDCKSRDGYKTICYECYAEKYRPDCKRRR